MDETDSENEESVEKLQRENAGEDDGEVPLIVIFERFSRFGDRESDGVTITLKNIDKWLKQTELLGAKGKFTNADTAITFSKVAKQNKRVDFDEFLEIIGHLAEDKNMDKEEIIEQLKTAEEPGMTNVTKPITSGPVADNIRRMTDPSLYTGSHRERFDEDGQGRGIAGREDRVEHTGYVSGFKRQEEEENEDKDV